MTAPWALLLDRPNGDAARRPRAEPRFVRTLALVLAALGTLSAAGPARAAGPLGPDGSPLTTSSYSVDLTTGVVLAGTRVLGLGGAYVAIAEGFDGMAQTAAAPAVRLPDSFDHFDYDIGFGLTFPASVAGNDLFNRGERTSLRASQEGALFLSLGALLQEGRWGFGLRADFTRFELAPKGQSIGLVSRFGGVSLALARSWFDGQLVTGLGSRGTGLVIENLDPQPGEPDELFHIEGAAAEVGVLWRPNWKPFRVGVALRSPVVTNDLKAGVPRNGAGDRILSRGGVDVYLPNAVALPWDVNVGLAVQLGPRPFNPRWVDPSDAIARVERVLDGRERERARQHRSRIEQARRAQASESAAESAAEAEDTLLSTLDELELERSERAVRDELRRRYRETKRFYVLISSSVLVTGPVKDGVGVESYLAGQVQRSGQRVTWSPHLGVETEVIPSWTKLRAGSYLEPSRFATERARSRLHGTGGFDQKLFPWTVFGLFDDDAEWRVSAAVDGARDYFAWGASIGVWH